MTNPQAPLRPCDDNELQRGLYEAIADACTTDGRRLRDVFHHESLRNIVLQITEGSDVLDKLLERHRRAADPVATGEPCNLPFERLPQHAHDPGVGPVPPIPKVVPLANPNEPAKPTASDDDRKLAADSVDAIMNPLTRTVGVDRLANLLAALRSRSQQVKP